MRGANQVLVSTFVADAAISQYAAVVQGTSDYHANTTTTANAGKFLGFTLDSTDASGKTIPVVMIGTGWVKASGAITAGDDVILSATAGEVEDASSVTAGTAVPIGRALSTTTAAGDYVLVLIK